MYPFFTFIGGGFVEMRYKPERALTHNGELDDESDR